MRKYGIDQVLIIAGIVLATIFVLPAIVRYGYCQGWWLDTSLLARLWWLCSCRPEFEQDLYPDSVEIIVSACRLPHTMRLSPNGRYMLITAGSKWDNNYLLDLVTGQEQPWPFEVYTREEEGFWTDTTVLIHGRPVDDAKLVEVTTGNIIKPVIFETDIYPDGQLRIPTTALQALKEADQVLLRTEAPIVLALSFNSRQDLIKGYVLFLGMWRQEFATQLETTFSENGIEYAYSNPCWTLLLYKLIKCPSHNGSYVVGHSAITTSDGRPIQEVPRSSTLVSRATRILGWAYDDSGVYLQLIPKCLVEAGPINSAIGCVPQPIIKLKVPEANR